jgi:hypothetical protein
MKTVRFSYLPQQVQYTLLCCRVFCHIFSQVFGPTLPSIRSHPEIYSATLHQLFWSFCPTLAVFCPNLSYSVRYSAFCPECWAFCPISAMYSFPRCQVYYPTLSGILSYSAWYLNPILLDIVTHSSTYSNKYSLLFWQVIP